jgi:hypothetical protein
MSVTKALTRVPSSSTGYAHQGEIAGHISGKDRSVAAGLAHVVSPIAKRSPDRKSSRWPELQT